MRRGVSMAEVLDMPAPVKTAARLTARQRFFIFIIIKISRRQA
jgi:hypothetical protein